MFITFKIYFIFYINQNISKYNIDIHYIKHIIIFNHN